MVKHEGAKRILGILLSGLVVGMLITVVGALITTWFVNAQIITEDSVGLASMVIILLSGMLTAAVTAGKGSPMRFLMCLAGGGIYMVGLLCIAAILFDGVKSGVIPTAFIAISGSIAVYLLGIKGGRRTKYKVPKIRR